MTAAKDALDAATAALVPIGGTSGQDDEPPARPSGGADASAGADTTKKPDVDATQAPLSMTGSSVVILTALALAVFGGGVTLLAIRRRV
ncbi:hypothetical protein [uncultured Bifidobacterium sp.]|uniref:hypothetical protein n=1 Tax=uncultured Bifidobacterium sp. TaxID=165187 RepID=UPI00258A245F|nr:hypothetical protein [uncultured Bifidobacterium sp.]MEE0654362.1 hypothetical protein [Bifidobacterium criceti]